MVKKKGRSIYLKYKEQSIISVALSDLIKYHQGQYEKECKEHEEDKQNIDEWHLDQMLEIRRLLDDKFKLSE